MSSVQPFASQAVRDTLGRSTDVDACVALVGQINRLLEQAATHLQGGGAGACAAYHSTRRERCEQSFLDPTVPSGIVALQGLQAVALALEAGGP